MKYILICLLLAMFLGCATTQHTVEVADNINLPTNILFLSQSGTQDSMFQTVLDLETNEMVVLEYHGKILSRVYRTGILSDPKNYVNFEIVGTDAPIPTETSSASKNTDGTPNNDGNSQTSF